MHVIYDVSHNIAKVEEHMVDGKQRTLLVHRKGSTRAFPPHHPLIPVDYQVRAPPVWPSSRRKDARLTSNSLLFSAHRSAGADRGDDGHLQLRPDGDRAGHDGDVRDHLPRSGTSPSSVTRSVCLPSLNDFLSAVPGPRALSSKVPQEPGLPGCSGQTGRHGHRHPSGVAQTGDGGGEGRSQGRFLLALNCCVWRVFVSSGSGIVQKRDGCREHVSRRRHQQDGDQTEADRRHQRLRPLPADGHYTWLIWGNLSWRRIKKKKVCWCQMMSIVPEWRSKVTSQDWRSLQFPVSSVQASCSNLKRNKRANSLHALRDPSPRGGSGSGEVWGWKGFISTLNSAGKKASNCNRLITKPCWGHANIFELNHQ